jgi:chromosome segregation ATPase
MKGKKTTNPTSQKLRGARKITKPKVDPSFVELFEEHDQKMQRYMGALSEDFKHQLSGVAEGVTMLGEKFDRMETRMGRVETKVDNLETKVDNLETTMNSKFKTVFDYLSRIDDELQDIKKEMERLSLTTANKTEIKELSYRVSNLERELAEVRRSVKV